MKKVIGFALGAMVLAAPAISTTANAQQLPPAKPGECFAKVLLPATYKTTAEEVVTYAGGEELKKIPAVYGTIAKQVLVEEESYELVTIPATYEEVTESILVSPEKTVKTYVPATYRNDTKEILISPSRVIWKVGRGLYEKLDSATGEIMCRVEVPAKYETVSQKVINTVAQTTEKVIPAKFVTVTRRVMKTPPSTEKKILPAQYKTVTIEELQQVERFETITTPPKYATVEKRELVTTGTVQWRQVLCETNTTQDVIVNIQRALIEQGYNIGKADGDYGRATSNAVRKFQVANNLPTGGLTLSTLKALGL